ncbi:histidine--tRNA ligase [Candidatus Pacearchaeota archaeon]|nr:histidine--tRNA ligase [Candidatus Pacearchaeota archaeon]
MIPEVDTVKGFQDYLPPISAKRAQIKRIVERVYRLYGFQPIETPVIEYDELMRPDALAGEQEDEAISDRFRLKDRAGRNLGLRYEFTFQLARILKLNPTIKLPFKRYQIGEQFRDEPIRLGRTRQFTQCDIDIIGDSSVQADAECIAVVMQIFKELGIKATVTINNRKLIEGIVESCELLNKKQVFREIDKLDKIGEDLVKMNLKKYGDANQVVTLFKLMEKDISFFEKNKFEGATEVKALMQATKMQGIEVVFRPSLMRGFSYYTGNVFEIVIEETKTALCGGGRYDKTVGKYLNREIPAVGISFSIEALMGLCEEQLTALAVPPPALVQLISIQQEKATQTLAQKVRKEGIGVSILSDKPGKCLEYASAYNIPYAIFIGEDELKKKKFKLRNLQTGNEQELTEKQLIVYLKKLVD